MSIEHRGDEQLNTSTTGESFDSSSMPPYRGSNNAASGEQNPIGPPPGGNYAGPYSSMPLPGAPNPALAGLLGFIPGVGAMYNGQFAKGIAHIAIFAVFCSLSKHVNGIFGLLIAGWVLYMAFEAYQTALARREGLPLPDPFGLNNIGERMGFRGNPDFSAFWAQGSSQTSGQQPPVPGQPGPSYGAKNPFYVDTAGTAFRPGSTPVEPQGQNYAPPSYAPPAGYAPPLGYPYAGPVQPPVDTSIPSYTAQPVYGSAAYGMPPMPPTRGSGLPAGALWLIGLGFLALLGSMRIFDFLQGEVTGGVFLIGLALFLLWRRWNATRNLYPAGSSEIGWSVLQCARGAGVVFLVGFLTLLQGLHVASWDNSWPFLLIGIGLLLLVERVALTRMTELATPAPPTVAPTPEQPANNASSTSILPRYSPAEDSTREGL